MPTSNRDRVGQGFELLATGLAPFIDHVLNQTDRGDDWFDTMTAKEATKHSNARTFSRNDPHVLLRVLTEQTAQFIDYLSRPHQALVVELRDARNRWAHNEAFDADDTYRTLDSIERLLTAAGKPGQVERVRRLRMDHQRERYEAETRKAIREASITSVPGAGLKPWRAVVRPHDDVATGQYNAAEFAADLHMVANGSGSGEYVAPVEFFQRTYLTDGLRDLLLSSARRLSGDMNASPVVNLQTNFGGGKTHSMLALYHLCSGTPIVALPQEVQEALAGNDVAKLGVIRRVALVGTHLMPGNPSVKPDGTVVRTLWGELAWQLGGRPAYEWVAEADRTATNPGEALTGLLRAYSPCLILIDEWVAYARQLYGRDDLPAGTFDTQFTFAQALTEVAKAVPGALVVISIPASDQVTDGTSDHQLNTGGSEVEIGGRYGLEALRRLQNVVRRVARQWRPASATESFEIVRRRLFIEPDAAGRRDIDAVARQLRQFYVEHRGEFPHECGTPQYEKRIRDAYPIHPELFDRLYQDWSTLERFQRTRGVLKLMSVVVHALWTAGDAGPLIMTGSVPLNVPAVASELIQYLPDAWRPILDADVDGEGSMPVRIDSERPTFGSRALTRRIARSIFLDATPTLSTQHKGVERQYVWLGVAVPGDTVGNFGSALEVLAQRATYLYVDGARYWYDTTASVTRTARDYADGLRDRPEEVWVELTRRLREERVATGDFAAVQVAPEDSAGVPDTEQAKLVIVHPRADHARGNVDSRAMSFARHCLDTRNSAQRANRNTVVFLAADDRRYEELAAATRDYLAWAHICGKIEELNLTAQQRVQAERRREQADDTVQLRIATTYIWTLMPDQPDPARPISWQAIRTEGSQPRLAERVTAKLKQQGHLATEFGALNVRMELDGPLRSVWERGHISMGDLWTYHARFPYLQRLRDRSVLENAVRLGTEQVAFAQEGFALAQGFDEASGRYVGLVGFNGSFRPITDSTLLVAPTPADAQLEADRLAAATGTEAHGPVTHHLTLATEGGADVNVRVTPRTPATPESAAPTNTRFFGVCRLNPQLHARDFNRIAQEVLAHLTGDGVQLTISLEISATNPEGFSESKVRTVTENARTLRFDQYGFEDR